MVGDDEQDRPSFWKSLPGVVSALGGLLVGVAAIVTAVIAIEAGQKQEPPITVPTSLPSATAVPLTAADLRKARLTVSDLPPGWADLPEATEIAPCNQAPIPAPSTTSRSAAFAFRQNGEDIGFAYTRLDGYLTESDAAAALDSVRANATRCASSEFTAPGGDSSFQFSSVTGPAIGDDVVHMMVSQRSVSTGVQVDGLTSIVRWGRTLLVVEVGAPGQRSPGTDSAQLDLTNRAFARIQTLPK